MLVYDLNSGRRVYPGYEEIENRRGQRRRSDGTYMDYGGMRPGRWITPPYNHHGGYPPMNPQELLRKLRELEDRQSRLEDRERRQMAEQRRVGYESYPTDEYGDYRYDGYGPDMIDYPY